MEGGDAQLGVKDRETDISDRSLDRAGSTEAGGPGTAATEACSFDPLRPSSNSGSRPRSRGLPVSAGGDHCGHEAEALETRSGPVLGSLSDSTV
jgi:hypothetical protein